MRIVWLRKMSQNLLSAVVMICLLSLLLMYFAGLYYKHYGPWSDCSLGSSDQGSQCLLPWKNLVWCAPEHVQQM